MAHVQQKRHTNKKWEIVRVIGLSSFGIVAMWWLLRVMTSNTPNGDLIGHDTLKATESQRPTDTRIFDFEISSGDYTKVD